MGRALHGDLHRFPDDVLANHSTSSQKFQQRHLPTLNVTFEHGDPALSNMTEMTELAARILQAACGDCASQTSCKCIYCSQK